MLEIREKERKNKKNREQSIVIDILIDCVMNSFTLYLQEVVRELVKSN